MSQSKKGNRFQISFKDNQFDAELISYMQKRAKKYGLSSYIKMLIKKEMDTRVRKTNNQK